MAFCNPKKRNSASPGSKKGKILSPASKIRKSASVASKRRKQKSKKSPALRKRKRSCSLECKVLVKLIDSGAVGDRDIVFYRRKRDNSVMKEGRITREGVLCSCCKQLFFLSKFEEHAGSTLHRPSANMFLRDGRSLVECQQSAFGGECFSPRRKPASEDKNDDICQICGDGGKLMLCDSCPSAFHAECLHLDKVPAGDWHCSRCRCGSCGARKDADSHESGTSMLSCVQCQVPYHRSCTLESREGSNGPWFCTKACHHVFKKLRRLVGRVFTLEKGLSWMLVRCFEEDCEPVTKNASGLSYEKLSEALKLLQHCFDPIMDFETGVNMLSQMVFNRKSQMRRMDCSGFYTILLMKEELLVSVATLRVHGKLLAEMPFVGTRYEFRQQGMCKALMKALETMLRGLGVYKLVIPSINEVIETWTGSFGFKALSLEDQKQLAGTNLSFPGTTLLYKSLHGSGITQCTKPVLNVVRRRSGRIQFKGKVLSSDTTLSRFQPISCH